MADVEDQGEYDPAEIDVEDRFTLSVDHLGFIRQILIQFKEDFLPRNQGVRILFFRNGSHVVQDLIAGDADREFRIRTVNQILQRDCGTGNNIIPLQPGAQLPGGNDPGRAGGIVVILHVFCPVDDGDLRISRRPSGVKLQAVHGLIEFQISVFVSEQFHLAVSGVQGKCSGKNDLSRTVRDRDCIHFVYVNRMRDIAVLARCINIVDRHRLRVAELIQVRNIACLRIRRGKGVPSGECIARTFRHRQRFKNILAVRPRDGLVILIKSPAPGFQEAGSDKGRSDAADAGDEVHPARLNKDGIQVNAGFVVNGQVRQVYAVPARIRLFRAFVIHGLLLNPGAVFVLVLPAREDQVS